MQTAIQITRGESALPKSPVNFDRKLSENNLRLTAATIDVLQINVGKLCNQACKHCHVDASPKRTEIMSRETLDACLKVLRECKIPTLDITGGAPEMIPDFDFLSSKRERQAQRLLCAII